MLASQSIHCCRLTRAFTSRFLRPFLSPQERGMASVNDTLPRIDTIPHIERTAKDPRQPGLYNVTLSRIDQVNSSIRLLRLSLDKDGPAFRHLPGEWLDVHIPHIQQAGGFTITSPPSTSSPKSSSPNTLLNPSPYLELAVQNSPSNPSAAYLWQPTSSILGKPMQVRVGGKFTYPPPALSFDETRRIDRAVFIAGGVGINPLMSMLSAMHGRGPGKVGGVPRQVRVLYTVRRRVGEAILFYDRLKEIAESYYNSKEVDFRFRVFETPGEQGESGKGAGGERVIEWDGSVGHISRRIGDKDLRDAIGEKGERKNEVVYVCGVPSMTDQFVDFLRRQEWLGERRVLCEKWW